MVKWRSQQFIDILKFFAPPQGTLVKKFGYNKGLFHRGPICLAIERLLLRGIVTVDQLVAKVANAAAIYLNCKPPRNNILSREERNNTILNYQKKCAKNDLTSFFEKMVGYR